MEVLTREQGAKRVENFGRPPELSVCAPRNVAWDEQRQRWKVPDVRLTVVGHFLRADFGRLFGRRFLAGLRLGPGEGHPRVFVPERKLLRFISGGHGRPPVLEYVAGDDEFFGVRVEMRDTTLPFGPGSLERHSRTFLGLGKSAPLTEGEKAKMLDTFQARTADASGYAVVDAVNTLLVHEQMQKKDREIYQAFGLPEELTPPLRPFQGGRASSFLLATTRAGVAAGSQSLGSESSLRELMGRGGAALFEDEPGASKYGVQSAGVHGGLLFSRSPTRPWHQGQIADVDLSGCYNEITARMNVYWGRPVILEPGSLRVKLIDAVAQVRRLADDDGWMVRVSGPIAGYANVLINSTDDALTGDNYKASAFVFQTPEQRAAVLEHLQRFEEKHGCGLEVLVLRQTYGKRREGSASDLLRDLYHAILRGESNLTRLLNLHKLHEAIEEAAAERREELHRSKERVEEGFKKRITAMWLPREALPTAFLVDGDRLEHFNAKHHALEVGTW